MNVALLISHAHWSSLFQREDPTHLCPAPPPFLIRRTVLTPIPGASRNALGTVRQSSLRSLETLRLAMWELISHPSSPSSSLPAAPVSAAFCCFHASGGPTYVHISKATLLSLCYAEFLFSTSVTATSPTIFITGSKPDIASLCHMYGLGNAEALCGISVHLRPLTVIQEPFLRIHMGE